MGARAQKVAVWLILGAIGVLVMWFGVLPRILYSGPVFRDTPFTREYARIHEICAKLASYSYDHKAFPDGEATGRSIDGLLAAGIISADDAAYIRDHGIQFRGFDPARIGADIAVFETVFTNTTSPRHIVGYSDGSTVWYDLDKRR